MPWVTARAKVPAMARVALLLKASANRVYGEASFGLAAAELALLDRALLGSVVTGIDRRTIGGVDYLLVDTDEVLDAQQTAILSNLSSLHAVFELADECFRPLPVTPHRVVDEDIVTIQRYSGKTNEALTHLLVNTALAAGGDAFIRLLAGERLRLLDGVCGRGTTLNRAALYGIDAVGVEHDQRDVDAYETFLLTWLRDKRLKHEVERARLRKGRAQPARRFTVTYGPGKGRAAHRVVEVVHDDTSNVREHVRPRSIDLLACDLPYGVQHGSRSAAGRLERRPGQLLEDALPGWFDVLRPGAGAALAWNRRTLPRAEVVELLTDAGFELRVAADDESFVHRVDRSVTRDVVVAARPAS